jgi:FMN phosphatase YigB (HAD superfamily)
LETTIEYESERMTALSNLIARVGQVEVVSSDVFDTLLLRTLKSERSRILQGERLFSELLKQREFSITADVLADARIRVQSLTFRALKLRSRPGEAKLEEIIGRQLSMLGLPQSLAAERLRIEIEIEKRALVPAERLAAVLRAHRRAGARIVASSDTTLPSAAVSELIEHFHGRDLIDRVYSSADHGSTKRHGDLFDVVAAAEGVPMNRILHIGDDWLADVQIPSAKGISVQHVPQPSYRNSLRRLDGALTEVARTVRARARVKAVAPIGSAAEFGRTVFGPIVTQFCLQIWLYTEAEVADNTVLLFCARGGIGIRQVFEEVVSKLSLPLRARRENFLISRLVAARAALLSQSPTALETIGIEFRGRTFADVATALGGRSYDLPDQWHRPLNVAELFLLIFGKSGAEVLADIIRQHEMFAAHFQKLAQETDRVILVDTGLYGSTQRLLASAFPKMSIETIQFARSNHKGQSEDHFPRVAGLVSERDFYDPLSASSCVLRYWQLIEKLFEPMIPSVRTFVKSSSAEIVANCGDINHGVFDPTVGNALLAGAIEYVHSLPVINAGAVASLDAETAWQRLRYAIVRPTPADLNHLDVGSRSVDFGRPDLIKDSVPERRETLIQKLTTLKGQLWREGAITRDFPALKHVLLPALSSIQSVRGLSRRFS